MFIRFQEIVQGARRTLASEGPLEFVRRLGRWLAGERRYHRRAIVFSENASLLQEHIAPVSSAQVIQQAATPIVPQISIIFPVFNALDYVQQCVASLFSMASDHAIELVLLDNGSDEETRLWLEQAASANPAITLVRSDHNLGYGTGMNLGVRYARAACLMLSNSDVLFTDHCLDILKQALEANPEIGVVSPVTNYVGEGLQLMPEAADLKPGEASAFAEHIRNDNRISFAPERLAFFSVMMRRAVFHLLNGFDETYLLANAEDEDFCARLGILGLRCAVVHNSFIYHYGSRTFAENAIDHTLTMSVNTVTYHNRLAEYSTDPMLAELRLRQGIARPSRATNPRFTVIIRTHSRPAKLRLALNSLAMQRADFEVIVVNDGGDDVSALVSHFEAHFPVRYIAFETPRSPSEASNAALAAMRGEYFIHLDDDDIVYPHHLASLDDLTRCHPDARVLYANWSRVLMREQNGVLNSVQRIYPPLWTFNRDSLLHSNFITIHASLFHRDVLQQIGEYEPSLRILQDWEYLIRASKCYDFVPLSRFTCEYRIYADISNSIVSKQQRALDEMKQIFAMHPTTNVAVNAQRAINIQAHQNQVNRIERLHEQVRAGTLSQESANAQILHMVTGFAIEENSARTALAAR